MHIRFAYDDNDHGGQVLCDRLADYPAALEFLHSWARSHHPRVRVVVITNCLLCKHEKLLRIPGETLWTPPLPPRYSDGLSTPISSEPKSPSRPALR